MRTVRSALGQPAAGHAAAGSARTFTRSFHATADQVGDARRTVWFELGSPTGTGRLMVR